MNRPAQRFCPQCATALVDEERGGRPRRVCPDPDCGYVHWDNPAPVVAAVLERDGKLVMVRSHGWPKHWFGLVTGFLEPGEMPEEAVLREVKEEVGLEGRLEGFIGMYPFYRMNQLILAYHVTAQDGEIALEAAELADYREVPIEKVVPWPMGTGAAVKDWLASRGIERDYMDWPPRGERDD